VWRFVFHHSPRFLPSFRGIFSFNSGYDGPVPPSRTPRRSLRVSEESLPPISWGSSLRLPGIRCFFVRSPPPLGVTVGLYPPRMGILAGKSVFWFLKAVTPRFAYGLVLPPSLAPAVSRAFVSFRRCRDRVAGSFSFPSGTHFSRGVSTAVHLLGYVTYSTPCPPVLLSRLRALLLFDCAANVGYPLMAYGVTEELFF